MIFNFTKEEEAQLFKISDDIKAYSEQSDIDEMIDKAMSFSRLLLEIEQGRREKIRTPEEIKNSAKELINDCFVYEYAIFSQGFEKHENEQIIKLSDDYISQYDKVDCLTWVDRYKKFKELLIEQPQELLFLFDKDSFRRHIVINIVSWHAYILKDTPANQELEQLINDCLENSRYIYHEKEKKEYRTVAKAKEAGAITEAPKSLIIPTMPDYQYSMSLYKEKNAHLEVIDNTYMENLEFENGMLFFKNLNGKEEIGEAELRDLRTNEGIEEIDLVELRNYYRILFREFEKSEYKTLKDFIIVSVPLLARKKNPNENDIDSVITKIKSYHNVMGVIKGVRNGKIRESYYQVLNFEYYDEKTNTVAFSSPYMNYVIQNIYNLSIRRENGRPQIASNGRPLTLPSHSYLIDQSILKERNKAAVENVILITTLIEQAGSKNKRENPPHISARNLIERNVQLAERLERSENQRALLKRVFSKTWELLREKTTLEENYKNIELPSPKDPSMIPTMRNLDELIFSFPHDGKIKDQKLRRGVT